LVWYVLYNGSGKFHTIEVIITHPLEEKQDGQGPRVSVTDQNSRFRSICDMVGLFVLM
jgi:hypothetical protein